MASVSSLSSSSSIYGSRNSHIISGLASGMDTESMIEGMVQGIKLKIDAQKQQQTILNWQQQGYRSISDQLVSLSTKYTSYTSSTNLMSESFFSPSIIESLGKYADKISASGKTNSNIEVLGATMSKNETITFTGLNNSNVQNEGFVTGSKEVDLKGSEYISNIAGRYISFEYNNQSFSITLPANGTYNSAQDVADAINEQLATIVSETDDKTKMSDTFFASVEDGKLKIDFKEGANKTSDLEITGGSSVALEALGLEEGDKLTPTEAIISDEKIVEGEEGSLYSKKSVADVLAGANMTINYNGQSAVIRFPEKDSEEYKAIFEESDAGKRNKAMVDYLQKQVDNAFGYGRITVSNGASTEGADAGKFTPKFELADKNATLSITAGSVGIVGDDSIFGIDYGATNKINTNSTLGELFLDKSDPDADLDDLGLTAVQGVGKRQDGKDGFVGEDGESLVNEDGDFIDENGNLVDKDGNRIDENGNKLYALEINGVKVGEYSKDTTLSKILTDINSSDAGVKVSYAQTANQFVFTSTHGGAGGRIEISDNKDESGNSSNLAAVIFGSVEYDKNGDISKIRDTEVSGVEGTLDNGNITFIQGQDATLAVNINGAKTTITSGTNTFDIDGLSLTVNGAFNPEIFDGNGGVTNADVEGVTFSQKADTDKIFDAIKTFVEDYNKMLADLGTAYTTKSNSDYKPLTDDQKAEMTEKQIEEYEAKAKEGILFADPDLKSLASDLRFLFSTSGLSNIGITTSTTASDRGKLNIDEEKLRAAIEGDLESVKDAFTAPVETDADGDVVSGGAMQKLKEVLDKYAATTGAVKGILIEKAGSQYSPTALLDNTIKSQIEDIDKRIDKLTDQLNDKIDFYTSKFTQLEMLISQMNSQSSYLSGMSGGY